MKLKIYFLNLLIIIYLAGALISAGNTLGLWPISRSLNRVLVSTGISQHWSMFSRVDGFNIPLSRLSYLLELKDGSKVERAFEPCEQFTGLTKVFCEGDYTRYFDNTVLEGGPLRRRALMKTLAQNILLMSKTNSQPVKLTIFSYWPNHPEPKTLYDQNF